MTQESDLPSRLDSIRELHSKHRADWGKDAVTFCADCFLLDLVEKAGEMEKALGECQRLAIERVSTADAAVKADVYAADALMGIAKTARDALAAYRAAVKGAAGG